MSSPIFKYERKIKSSSMLGAWTRAGLKVAVEWVKEYEGRRMELGLEPVLTIVLGCERIG